MRASFSTRRSRFKDAIGMRAPVSHGSIPLVFTVTMAGDAALYAPLWIARLHQRLGDQPGARTRFVGVPT